MVKNRSPTNRAPSLVRRILVGEAFASVGLPLSPLHHFFSSFGNAMHLKSISNLLCETRDTLLLGCVDLVRLEAHADDRYLRAESGSPLFPPRLHPQVYPLGACPVLSLVLSLAHISGFHTLAKSFSLPPHPTPASANFTHAFSGLSMQQRVPDQP